MDYGLDGKIVLITGAGSGIGLATATAFAQQGAQVVAADLVPDAVKGISADRAPDVSVLDVREEGAVEAFVDRAGSRYGHIDVLVNNVGIAPYRAGFLDVSDGGWRSTLEVNFFSMIKAARAAIPHMRASGRGGSIVSIASDAGRQPDPFFVDYAVSKAAVLSLSKSLSIEFGVDGIRANCVSPGPTATPAMDGFLEKLGASLGKTYDETKEYFAKEMRKLPLGRMNEPSDVAAVVLFLASDLARQVTGAAYSVDAGAHIYV